MENPNQLQFTWDEIFSTLWRFKSFSIIFLLLFSIIGVVTSFQIKPRYESRATLYPKFLESNTQPSISFGGFSALTGSGQQSEDILTLLRATTFLLDFSQNKKVRRIVFANTWDTTADTMVCKPNCPTRDMILEAVKKSTKIMTDDKRLSISITATSLDSSQSYELANLLIDEINSKTYEYLKNVTEHKQVFFEEKYHSATDASIKESILNLWQDEITKQSFITTTPFVILEAPLIPEKPVWPKKKIIFAFFMTMGILFFILFSLSFGLLWPALRKKASQ